MSVRRAIHLLKQANLNNIEDARKEFQTSQTEHLPKCGAQMVKLSAELQQAKDQCEAKMKTAEEAQKKAQEIKAANEAKRAEALAKADELISELNSMVEG